MFAQSESKETKQARLEVGALVKGRVVAVGPETAFVALGGKAEAAIGLGEFRDEETGEHTLSIGDTVEVTITDDGSQSGSIVLKRTFGRGGRVPGELETSPRARDRDRGASWTGRNKGGFDVQVAGQRAFCPASQMDRRRGDGDPDAWIGQRLRPSASPRSSPEDGTSSSRVATSSKRRWRHKRRLPGSAWRLVPSSRAR